MELTTDGFDVAHVAPPASSHALRTPSPSPWQLLTFGWEHARHGGQEAGRRVSGEGGVAVGCGVGVCGWDCVCVCCFHQNCA